MHDDYLFNALNKQTFTVYADKNYDGSTLYIEKQKNHDEKS